MKLLFDQNISYRILKSLPEKFKNSSHIKKEGSFNASDREVWEYAKRNNYTIVTHNSDFNNLNSLYGFPPKVIWIRTGNIKTSVLNVILKNYLDDIENFIKDDKYGCFEINKNFQ